MAGQAESNVAPRPETSGSHSTSIAAGQSPAGWGCGGGSRPAAQRGSPICRLHGIGTAPRLGAM